MRYQQVEQPFYISEINILMTMVLMAFLFFYVAASQTHALICVLCHQVTTSAFQC